MSGKMSQVEEGNHEGEEEAAEGSNFYGEDEGEYESFDDIDEDFYDEPTEVQGTTATDDDNEEESSVGKPAKSAKQQKKESAKKAKGQKGDDMEAVQLAEEEESEEARLNEDEEEEESEEEEKEDSEEEKEEAPEEESKEEQDKSKESKKGKPSYVEVDGETFALDSNAVIHTKVDGKTEKVTLQELKNNYAGKVAYDKKMNEVNLKETSIKREQESFKQQLSHFTGLKSKIEEIVKNPEMNPKEAFKIFVDAIGMDAYDLEEKMFKADLEELANVLAMEAPERKAYFLEKRNSHLLDQAKKRDERIQAEEKRNSYKAKADALRKSYNVSEAQYVDALEELVSFGNEQKDITEQQIVEWAATKPHREKVGELLKPYEDQFSDEGYGELSWKLSMILMKGGETPDDIAKHLKEVYGQPTKVKELSKKLRPLGRKPKQPVKPIPKKHGYESFDDIDED